VTTGNGWSERTFEFVIRMSSVTYFRSADTVARVSSKAPLWMTDTSGSYATTPPPKNGGACCAEAVSPLQAIPAATKANRVRIFMASPHLRLHHSLTDISMTRLPWLRFAKV
jgi:hypothetical protein